MLIVGVLGTVAVLVALSAWRFARMDVAREQALAAGRVRKLEVFEGVLTPRAAREAVPDALLQAFAGERVRVTAERLGSAEP